MEYFVKVWIKSEDDLPKVGDILNYVEVKGDKIYHTLSVTNKENKEWWLYNVISYCINKPVEIPEITDEEIENRASDLADPSSKKDFSRGEWLGFKEGAKWYREELKKRLK
jgi:hypothetical protein